MHLCLVAGASIKMTFSVYGDPGQYSRVLLLQALKGTFDKFRIT